MFFCDECAEKNKWPKSFSKSQGNCEICKKFSVCNDVPSYRLSDTYSDQVTEKAMRSI